MIRKIALLIGMAALWIPQTQASLLVTVLNPDVLAPAGTTITFQADLTNGFDYDLYVNLSAINIEGTSFTWNDLYIGLDQQMVPAATTLPSVNLLQVLVSDPWLDADGTYNGTYTFLGGADEFAQNVLATGNFSLTIDSTPEPATWALLGGTAPLLLLYHRRRRLQK